MTSKHVMTSKIRHATKMFVMKSKTHYDAKVYTCNAGHHYFKYVVNMKGQHVRQRIQWRIQEAGPFKYFQYRSVYDKWVQRI